MGKVLAAVGLKLSRGRSRSSFPEEVRNLMDTSRILCVDDNAALLTTLKLGLDRYGFEVVTARDGLEGLAQFKAFAGEFDVVLTDNEMPNMDGIEFVCSLRKEGFEGLIVVMSGNLTAENAEAYSMQRIAGFFRKPFEVGMLAELILKDGEV